LTSFSCQEHRSSPISCLLRFSLPSSSFELSISSAAPQRWTRTLRKSDRPPREEDWRNRHYPLSDTRLAGSQHAWLREASSKLLKPALTSLRCSTLFLETLALSLPCFVCCVLEYWKTLDLPLISRGRCTDDDRQLNIGDRPSHTLGSSPAD
jgi:hypothetical protein